MFSSNRFCFLVGGSHKAIIPGVGSAVALLRGEARRWSHGRVSHVWELLAAPGACQAGGYKRESSIGRNGDTHQEAG